MEGKGFAIQPKAAAAAPEPGTEAKSEPAVAYDSVEIGVNFKDGLGGKPSALPGSWPNFRGPNYDFTVKGVSLANKWPKGGPPVKWKLTGLGEGYSGAAVHAGRVYLQDYEPAAKEESLRCFSLDDGKEIWKRSYVMPIGNSHGFTRTVPAVTDKYAVVFGSMCHIMCVDAQSGELKWTMNLMKDFGTQSMFSLWYASQCPIIDGNTVVLAPCGKEVLMMGVDLETGKILWKTPNPGKLNMAHSSITPMTLNGKKQYVYCAERGNMVGVSAEKGSEGALLWEVNWTDQQVISPSPVVLDDGHIFMTAGVGAGSALIKLTEQGDKVTAKIVWKLKDKETLACEQQTPIYFDKHLFALHVRSGGARQDQLVCMNPFDKGKFVWESGNQKKFGYYEPTLLADGKFYVVGKDASLTMVRATKDKYEELGRCKLLDGGEPWGPIALAGSLMIFRDSKVMICIDVGKGIE
jgi:outer membrane protein assembly factor BamB